MTWITASRNSGMTVCVTFEIQFDGEDDVRWSDQYHPTSFSPIRLSDGCLDIVL